jgi:hypothetical protein
MLTVGTAAERIRPDCYFKVTGLNDFRRMMVGVAIRR